jgi:hypothetical protein
MVVDPSHAAFEDLEHTFNGVRADITAYIFVPGRLTTSWLANCGPILRNFLCSSVFKCEFERRGVAEVAAINDHRPVAVKMVTLSDALGALMNWAGGPGDPLCGLARALVSLR